jgi:zinc/manganese transport system ATP-binding protein
MGGVSGGLFTPRPSADKVQAALASVGLDELRSPPCRSTLGTGQFQRLLFARMMTTRTPGSSCSTEPFAALDARTTADLMRLLHTWHAEGRTIVAAPA